MRHWYRDSKGNIVDPPPVEEVSDEAHEQRYRGFLIGGLVHPRGGNHDPKMLAELPTHELAKMAREMTEWNARGERMEQQLADLTDNSVEVPVAEYERLQKLAQYADRAEEDAALRQLEEEYGT